MCFRKKRKVRGRLQQRAPVWGLAPCFLSSFWTKVWAGFAPHQWRTPDWSNVAERDPPKRIKVHATTKLFPVRILWGNVSLVSLSSRKGKRLWAAPVCHWEQWWHETFSLEVRLCCCVNVSASELWTTEGWDSPSLSLVCVCAVSSLCHRYKNLLVGMKIQLKFYLRVKFSSRIRETLG